MKPSISPSATTTAPVSVTESAPGAIPEFTRLPARGPCPWIGLSRSTILALEKAGAFSLIRVRRPGHVRGIVLVPVETVSAYLRTQGAINA